MNEKVPGLDEDLGEGCLEFPSLHNTHKFIWWFEGKGKFHHNIHMEMLLYLNNEGGGGFTVVAWKAAKIKIITHNY